MAVSSSVEVDSSLDSVLEDSEFESDDESSDELAAYDALLDDDEAEEESEELEELSAFESESLDSLLSVLAIRSILSFNELKFSSLASLAVLAAAILAEAIPSMLARRALGVVIGGSLGGKTLGPPTMTGFGLRKSGKLFGPPTMMGFRWTGMGTTLPTGRVSLGPAIDGLIIAEFLNPPSFIKGCVSGRTACYLFFVLIRVCRAFFI